MYAFKNEEKEKENARFHLLQSSPSQWFPLTDHAEREKERNFNLFSF